MVITHLHDLQDLVNQADIYLFGVDKKTGTFTTPWVEEEMKTNPALYKELTQKLIKSPHNKDLLKGVSSQDEHGIYRFFFSCLVEKDGVYSDNQISALKYLLERTVKSNRDYPLMDMFGSIFDLLSRTPNDQPGGIYVAGPPTAELEGQLTRILGNTMIDCFLYEPLDKEGKKMPEDIVTPPKKSDGEEMDVDVQKDSIEITLEQEKKDGKGTDQA